jgi:hypothetical protein
MPWGSLSRLRKLHDLIGISSTWYLRQLSFCLYYAVFWRTEKGGQHTTLADRDDNKTLCIFLRIFSGDH